MATETVPPAGAAAPIPRPEVIWGAYSGISYNFNRIDPARLLSSGLLSAGAMPGERIRAARRTEGGVRVRRCADGMVNASMPAALAIQRDARFARFRAGLLADTALRLVAGEAVEAPAPTPVPMNGAGVALSTAGGVLTFRYSGPITAEFLAGLHTARTMSPTAVVADFTEADCRFNGAELDAAMGPHLLANPRSPRALVIVPRQALLFREHAMRFAVAHAAFQRAFYDRGQAEAWALDAMGRASR